MKSRIIEIVSKLIVVLYCLLSECNGADMISQGDLLKDGDVLVSAGQVFSLGFFSPDNSTLRFVGIWYTRVSTDAVLWVANRNTPITGRNGSLTIENSGNLVILDGNGSHVWSTNTSFKAENSTLILLDSGNLVLSDSSNVGNTGEAHWQSFEHPTDTFLPGMKVKIGDQKAFISWKSSSDPSLGRYRAGIDLYGSPEVVFREESTIKWRSGHWNGLIFTGIPDMNSLYLYGFRLHMSSGEMYFTYTPSSSSNITRFRVRWDGKGEHVNWDDEFKRWNVVRLYPSDECGSYNLCGDFAICDVTGSELCTCLGGFEPKSLGEWESGNWSNGCVRKTELSCRARSEEGGDGDGDGFLKIEEVKLPDFGERLDAQDGDECEEECLKNCSCNAFTFESGIGCMVWKEDIVDVQSFSDGGNTLFVRVDKSELGGGKGLTIPIIVIIAMAVLIVLTLCVFLLWRFMASSKESPLKLFKKIHKNVIPKKRMDPFFIGKSKEYSEEMSMANNLGEGGNQGNGQELLLFSFNSIEIATDYFSLSNKLGEGGFGPVYKGKLAGGKEIAVKRLSKRSGQGMEEFKNEIALIANLQHINLVRLLGCCAEGEEKMLIYELMPNRSLDSFLFVKDVSRRAILDWATRFRIIEGTARGLLYLHRDSRLRIIHRDLKSSNILLDKDMNPKISDFGLARIFNVNESEANTNRVVGTYGYMAPEYAMDGLFSVKSDVYSFGILLLELLSGKRNINYQGHDQPTLIETAWEAWKQGKVKEFIDGAVKAGVVEKEVRRCIQVGLLCVQDAPGNRPNMSSVVLMLESDYASLPDPRQPMFTGSMRRWVEAGSYPGISDPGSSTGVTLSVILGR